jgi:hypothetical protein
MKTIAELPSLSEAYVLKSLLEVEGIEAFIPDEDMGGEVVELPSGIEIRVQVAEEDVERAVEITEGFPGAKVRRLRTNQALREIGRA